MGLAGRVTGSRGAGEAVQATLASVGRATRLALGA